MSNKKLEGLDLAATAAQMQELLKNIPTPAPETSPMVLKLDQLLKSTRSPDEELILLGLDPL